MGSQIIYSYVNHCITYTNMIILFYILNQFLLVFSCQDAASYKAENVSSDVLSVSETVQIKTQSTVECGIRCLKKYQLDKSCTAIIFDENSSICTLIQLAFYPTGLRLAWASSIFPGLHAWFAIDRNIKTGSHALLNIFASNTNGDSHPWFAIDLLVPHVIEGVDIVARKDGWTDAINNIEVRIGDTKPFEGGTNGNTNYNTNTVCGIFLGPGEIGSTSVVTCAEPLIGRYVTLQRISEGDTNIINWSEIVLESTILKSETIEILKMDVKKIGSHDKCPPTVGLSECPSTHPYSYKQGHFCCPINIDYERSETAQPHLNFDSEICKDDVGIDNSISCDNPPCVNFLCRRYQCVLTNMDLSGGKFDLRKFTYKNPL